MSQIWQSLRGRKKDLDAEGPDGEEDCFQRPGKMMRRNRNPAKRSRMITKEDLRKIIDEAQDYEEDGEDYYENAFDPEEEEDDSASRDSPTRPFTPGSTGHKHKTQLRP